jgi:hypothetical protein
MSRTDSTEFSNRKAQVEQALRTEKFNWIEDYKGISTIKRLVAQTGLNEQAIKRIIKNLEKEGKVDIIEDKSHIVLLKGRI